MEILESRPGSVTLRATGRGAVHLFRNEAGGHRWQRVPPGEKRGRVHTSTVTVAVLREPEEAEIHLDPAELAWSTCRPTGSGGQAMQKTESAVQLRHLPTGIHVRVESERSQQQNRVTALGLLRAKLLEAQVTQAAGERNGARRAQIGSGQRGDKRRTVRVQDGVVTDHPLGVRITLRDYLRGDWGPLLE